MYTVRSRHTTYGAQCHFSSTCYTCPGMCDRIRVHSQLPVRSPLEPHNSSQTSGSPQSTRTSNKEDMPSVHPLRWVCKHCVQHLKGKPAPTTVTGSIRVRRMPQTSGVVLANVQAIAGASDKDHEDHEGFSLKTTWYVPQEIVDLNWSLAEGEYDSYDQLRLVCGDGLVLHAVRSPWACEGGIIAATMGNGVCAVTGPR